MKNRRKLSFVMLGLWLAVATGCIGEDSCGTSFTVRAYDTDRLTELDHSSVQDVTVYIFDHNDLFIREVKTTVGATVKMPVPAGDFVKIVAWGNLGGGNQTRPALKAGDHMSTGAVELTVLSRAENIHQTPDELFMGTAIVPKETGSAGQIVPIYRKTGKIGVIIEGIRELFYAADNEFSVIVRTTRGVIPFSGSREQQEVAYRLDGAFNADGEYVVEPVNIFAEDDITIEIFQNDRLVDNVWTPTDPIDVWEGLTTTIRYIFWVPSYIGSELVPMPWEKEDIVKKYL